MDIVGMITALNARRMYLGLSLQELADRLHKDLSTVQKQFSLNNPGMNFNTLSEYAAVLGGEIIFQTKESLEVMSQENLDNIRMRITELGSQNDRLRSRLNERDEEIKMLLHQVEVLQTANIEKDKMYAELVHKIAEKL